MKNALKILNTFLLRKRRINAFFKYFFYHYRKMSTFGMYTLFIALYNFWTPNIDNFFHLTHENIDQKWIIFLWVHWFFLIVFEIDKILFFTILMHFKFFISLGKSIINLIEVKKLPLVYNRFPLKLFLRRLFWCANETINFKRCHFPSFYLVFFSKINYNGGVKDLFLFHFDLMISFNWCNLLVDAPLGM